MFKSIPLISLTKHTINIIPEKDNNSSILVPVWDTVKMETCRGYLILLLKADILFRNDWAFSRQDLIFLTYGPGFKLMSPERIKMMDYQGLTFLKQCVTWQQSSCSVTKAMLQLSKEDSKHWVNNYWWWQLFWLVGAVDGAVKRMEKQNQQEGQKCPKRQVAQAAIRLATAVIKFRNKERNVRSPR